MPILWLNRRKKEGKECKKSGKKGEDYMSRLSVESEDKAQQTVALFYQALGKRLTAVPEGNCPLNLSLAFLRLCLSQSCGKCVPCRVGLDQLAKLLEDTLAGKAELQDLKII